MKKVRRKVAKECKEKDENFFPISDFPILERENAREKGSER